MIAEQRHIEAIPATVCDDLWDIPASQREAAFASGSMAMLNRVGADNRAENVKSFGAFNFGRGTPTTMGLVVSAARG